jgi:putative DNA primase/helicase
MITASSSDVVYLHPPLSIARSYIDRHWNPVPVLFRSKIPIGEKWQLRVIDHSNVSQYFGDTPQNVGVVMGPLSKGLTDVDLDCREAIDLAPMIIPKTTAIFGRRSSPAAHWLYYTTFADTAGKAEFPFSDPTLGVEKAMLVELRIGGDKGAQTVFPGSTHEHGELIRWDETGEPVSVDGNDLHKRVALLAAACLFARYWPANGVRHQAALAIGGFLARAGHPAPFIKYLVERIARTAGDDEVNNRREAAYDAAIGFTQGKNTFGYPMIAEYFGERVAKKIADWVGYDHHHDDEHDSEPTSPKKQVVTEDSAALQFVDLHGDKMRYCHSTGAWFRFNGVSWTKDETWFVFQQIRELNRNLAKQDKKSGVSKTSFAAGVERFAKVDQRVAVTFENWDADPWLLGTPGGTVDLRTGELRESRRQDGVTKLTSVAPDVSECPLWRKFLDEATNNDDEMIVFLQQWCGYCLTGITREHSLVFVHGGGGNGKGVFLNVVSNILNDYAVTAAMDTFTASRNDRHSTELAMLRGARLVTASETEEGRAWAEARIKQMTGGDPITARFMRQDFFTYKPNFKLTIIGNHKPVLRNVDDATRRRFLIVPFRHKPEKPDRELEQKLMAEAPAILQWMIEGCLDWQAKTLVKPQSVLDETNE